MSRRSRLGRRPTAVPHGALACTAMLLLCACREPSPEAPAAEEPTGAEARAEEIPEGSGAATSAEPSTHRRGGFVGDAACATCHAEQAGLFEASAHRLAARSAIGLGDEWSAEIGSERALEAAGTDEAAWDAEARALVVADARGAVEPRPVSHVLGGWRRIDLLSPTPEGLQVLPLSWSKTRETWSAPLVEERGAPPGPDSPWSWERERRRHALQCSRCHPITAEAAAHEADPVAGAAQLEPGIGCEHCHGPGAAHVAAAERAAENGSADGDVRGTIVRAAPDTWSGCAHCHAVGTELPREANGELRADEAFDDHLLPATVGTPLGPDRAFLLDGRPATPHGYEVQGLAQSGHPEVTCLTCHDPHGGPGGMLRHPDPDEPCRTCHPDAAGDPAAHARHPVLEGAVPSARLEPSGPAHGRLPGCVDCHLPAVLAFSPEDRVREHVIGSPDPELAATLRAPGACTSCHPDRTPRELGAWLDERFPDRSRERAIRARSFRAATALLRGGDLEAPTVVELLREQLASPAHEWTRAAAAAFLSGLGPAAAPAAADLLEAADSTDDVVLARHALFALASIGPAGRVDAGRVARLAEREGDWRLRLPAAVALDAMGDPRGAVVMEILRNRPGLPAAARAEATFELGMSFPRRGALRRAEYHLDQATRQRPLHVAAWLNLGAVRANLDDAEGARAAWLRVLDLSPENPHALGNLRALERREAGAEPGGDAEPEP